MLRFIAGALALTSTVTFAGEFTVGDLTVTNSVSFETAAMARAGAGYMDITNTGADDTLLAVEADFPRVMLHNSVMDGDVARMEHLMSVPIPSGETVSFAPGGLHVMFMGLGGDRLEVGETIDATLVFENAGRLDVIFAVVARPADGADHSGH